VIASVSARLVREQAPLIQTPVREAKRGAAWPTTGDCAPIDIVHDARRDRSVPLSFLLRRGIVIL
jgi:hypothetical protein